MMQRWNTVESQTQFIFYSRQPRGGYRFTKGLTQNLNLRTHLKLE